MGTRTDGWWGSDGQPASAQSHVPHVDAELPDLPPPSDQERRTYPLGRCQVCGLAVTVEGVPGVDVPDHILARLPPPAPMLCTCPPGRYVPENGV